MKIMMMAALLAGMGVEAGEAAEPVVTVCMESGVAYEVGRAQMITGQMFADIGIKIDWHKVNKCPEGTDGIIHVKLDTGVPPNRFPGALAIALPYEGVHIQAFMDRIRESVTPKIEPILLAHVLAHEITHILQGVSRHSESGVMKATWDQMDFEKMAWKPLTFTEEDVKLIRFGLQAWSAEKARTQLAANSGPAVAVQ
jgi:hypothetical protein